MPDSKNTILYEAIDSALRSLGEPVRNTLLWYLRSSGLHVDAKSFDIREFHSALQKLVGPGADIIFEAIYQNLLEKRQAKLANAASESSDPLTKIDRILGA